MSDVARRIVVGVDGSRTSAHALQWALRQADATGSTIEAVIAWDVPASYGFGPTARDDEDLSSSARASLAATVADVAGAHSSVSITQRVERGHPAAVLLDRSKDAELLVVGSHGRGGFVSALLGSVSHHCVQHARCPVVVVRRTDTSGAEPG